MRAAQGNAVVADFTMVSVNRNVTLPHVPDTDAIGFNPETGVLYIFSNTQVSSLGLVPGGERSDMAYILGQAPNPDNPKAKAEAVRLMKATLGPEHPHNIAWGDEDGKTRGRPVGGVRGMGIIATGRLAACVG